VLALASKIELSGTEFEPVTRGLLESRNLRAKNKLRVLMGVDKRRLKNE
jgi:hypothetical protein